MEKNENTIESQNEEKKEEEKNKVNEEEIKLLETIKKYFSGPNIDENNNIQDISYEKWVSKNQNIKKLCEIYEVEYSKEQSSIIDNSENNIIIPKKTFNSKDIFGYLENHDFACELKLLKWITEDDNHKNKFIKIENKEKKKLNRFNDILPYEYNIVPLDINNTNKNDINNYINASYITNPFDNKSKLFIATQTPLENTISSFWKMIYNHKIKLIIMLSNSSEEEKYKKYWPNNKEEILKLNEGDVNLNIELIHKEEIAPQIALLRKFKINNELEVKQIQVISWPEHGLLGEEYLANMIFEKLIKYFNDQIKDNNIPVVVHCYDGVGRTGTLIAIILINMCLEKIKAIKKEPMMCVFNVIRKLREQRYSFVTDIEQYKYIYHFSLYWIKKNYPL